MSVKEVWFVLLAIKTIFVMQGRLEGILAINDKHLGIIVRC